jgi:hypothetical protein
MSIIDLQKRLLLDCEEWISTAEALLASAALFKPQLKKYWESKGTERKNYEKFLKSNLMLAGFALENVLKALIVQDQRESLEQEFITKNELPKILKSHNLIKLAERAGLQFTDDGTKKLLNHLTRHSVWAGRYPIPLRPSEIPAEDIFGLGANFISLSGFASSDWKNVQILFQRAIQIIKQRATDKKLVSNAPLN